MQVAAAVSAFIVLAFTASACGDSRGHQVALEPSDSTVAAARPATLDAPPTPLATLPEGLLLVQKESSIAVPIFGIGPAGSTIQYSKSIPYVDGPPQVSPDGRFLALPQRDEDDLLTGIRVASSQQLRVWMDGTSEVASANRYAWLSWSADSTSLAFALPTDHDSTTTDIYIANVDGLDARQVSSTPDSYYPIGWARDGQFVVHASWGLVALGLDKPRALSIPGQPSTDVSISPDGKTAIIQAFDESRRTFTLWTLDIETGESRELTDSTNYTAHPTRDLIVSSAPSVAPNGGSSTIGTMMLKAPPPVVWSPDSSRIAYYKVVTDASSSVSWELHVANLGSGTDTAVTETTSFLPAWSPDGRHLAFLQRTGVTIDTLTLLDEDGTLRDTNIQVTGFHWSPEGQLIVAEVGAVHIIDPESLNATEVLTTAGEPIPGAHFGELAIWSPGGRYLAFNSESYRTGYETRTYILDTQTGIAELLLDQPGGFRAVGWLQ